MCHYKTFFFQIQNYFSSLCALIVFGKIEFEVSFFSRLFRHSYTWSWGTFLMSNNSGLFFFLSWFIIKRVELDLHIIRRRFAYLQGENSRGRGIQMSWATPPFWNSRRWERGRRAGGVFLFFKDFSSFFLEFCRWVNFNIIINFFDSILPKTTRFGFFFTYRYF